MEPMKATSVNSRAEELFVQLFCEAFGPEKTENLQVQYPCVDIYGRHRYIDFALESPESKIAIEIDGETYHNPSKVSENKYADDLLKQNSLVYDNWKVCPTVCTGYWTLQNISPWRMCWRRRTSASWIRICCSRAKSRRRGWMCRSMCPTMRSLTFSTGRTASRI